MKPKNPRSKRRRKIAPGTLLDTSNYRAFADEAINTYADKGRIADAMFWRAIIDYYNFELRELKKRVRL